MTSQTRKSIALVLTLIYFWGLPQAGAIIVQPDRCEETTDGLDKKNEDLYGQSKGFVTKPLPTVTLDACYELAKKWLRTCARVPTTNPFCLQSVAGGGAVPAGDTGLTGSFDASIEALVSAANCKYATSHCYRLGDNGGVNLRHEMQNTCFDKPINQMEAASPEDRNEYSAVLDYYKKVKGLLDPASACWRAAGEMDESDARGVLASRNRVQNEETPKGAIDCINNDNGNRLCRYSQTGSRFENLDDPSKANDPTIADQKAGAAQLGDRCSGTLLGDGRTVVTAGHCTQASNKEDGFQQLAVYDADGKQHFVQGSCSPGQFTRTTQTDVSVCKLSTPIGNPKPIYVAVNDPSVTGSGCRVSGYVKYCGDQYFQNLSQQPVQMAAYPGQFDESTLEISNQLHGTTGTMYYDTTTKNFSTDMMCTGGCSGGGYLITEPNGTSVVVSTHSYGTRFDNSGGGTVIPRDVWDSMRVQSVGAEQLQAGEYTIQSLNAVR